MEGSKQRTAEQDEDIGTVHRRLFATGELSEIELTGVALEALERADVDLFLRVTNVTRQSEDTEVLERTSNLLDMFAEMTGADLSSDSLPEDI